MRSQLWITPLVGIFGLLTFPALGQEEQEDSKRPIPDPVEISTNHRGDFGGITIPYRATVADVRLQRDDGTPWVSVFTTSYLATETASGQPRPVSFVFNGGPGSSSVWLHMGLMGPRRVVVPSDAGHAGLPPYEVVHNEYSPLDVTDLVFLDPPGTGFSRLVGDGKPEEVYGLREDARTLAAVIREWMRKHDRWNDPIYLVGESFGTTRAAAMLPALQRGPEPVLVAGVIMISQAMDYAGSSPYVGDNFASDVTYLPTMAATAWYHGKVERDGRTLEQFLDEVRDFTVDTYMPALFRGSTLDEEQRRSLAGRIAGYLGLDPAYVLRSDLRVNPTRFVKELLREEGLAIGRLDGRYTADEIDDVAERPSFDAGAAAIGPAYATALRLHLREALQVDLDRPYNVSGPEVGRNWVWDRTLSRGGEPRYVNTAPDLAEAMSYNPMLRVLVASGYYDYATPFFDAEYTVQRHGIDLSRVTMTYYEAGHMMYVHQPSLEAVARDIRTFLRGD